MAKFDFNSFPEATEDKKESKGFSFDNHPVVEDKPAVDNSVGLGDILRPASQGITLGFGDELLGGAMAAKDTLTGENGLSFDKIVESYKRARDSEREANEASEKKHPLLYKGIELGSGFLAPIPGLGAAKGATLAAKLGKMALEGAAIGGTAAAGYSKADDLKGLGKDVAVGSTIGALPAGALGTFAGIAKAGKHIPYLGIGPTSAGITEGLAGHTSGNVNLTGAIENTLESLGSKRKEIKAAYDSMLNAAQEEGRTLNSADLHSFVRNLQEEAAVNRSPDFQKDVAKITDLFNNYAKDSVVEKIPFNIPASTGAKLEEGLMNSAGQPVKANVTPAMTGEREVIKDVARELSPHEAQSLKSNLKDLGQFNNPALQTSTGKSFAKQIGTEVSEQLGDIVPGLKANDEQYASIMGVLEQLGIKAENLYTKNVKTGKLEIDPDALRTVQSILKQAVTEKSAGAIGQRKIGLLSDGLEKLGLGNQTPELLEKARISTVFDQPKGKFGGYLGYGAQGALDSKVAKVGLGTLPGIAGAYNKPKNSAQLSEDTKTASKQALSKMANVAMQSPNLQSQGEQLQKAVDTGDLRRKNQILFDLMQRPNYRSQLEGVSLDNDSDNE